MIYLHKNGTDNYKQTGVALITDFLKEKRCFDNYFTALNRIKNRIAMCKFSCRSSK